MIDDGELGGNRAKQAPKLSRGGKKGARTRRIDSVLKLAKDHQESSFKWPSFSGLTKAKLRTSVSHDNPPIAESAMAISKSSNESNMKSATGMAHEARTSKAGTFHGGKPPSGPKKEPCLTNGVPNLPNRGTSK